MKEYNWVSLGCGVIANQLATAMQKEGRSLYGVANRTYSKALEFAKKYQISKVYENIENIFTDENVDIIYISTPHNTHKQYLEKALRHGIGRCKTTSREKSSDFGRSNDHLSYASI